jgi:hypothetical protein
LEEFADEFRLSAVGDGNGHEIERALGKIAGAVNLDGGVTGHFQRVARIAGPPLIHEPAQDLARRLALLQIGGKLSPSEGRT